MQIVIDLNCVDSPIVTLTEDSTQDQPYTVYAPCTSDNRTLTAVAAIAPWLCDLWDLYTSELAETYTPATWVARLASEIERQLES